MLVGMSRIALSDDQRRELRERTRQTGLAPSTRDRLEMVRLSGAGWSVPRIARHLGQHEQTVRAWINAFLRGGVDALPNNPRGGRRRHMYLDDGPTGRVGGRAPRRPPGRRPRADPPAPGGHLLAAHEPYPAAQTGSH